MTGLDAETIAKLLAEDAAQPKRGGGRGRAKADPTADRTLPGWFKLGHHLCTRDCPHRTNPDNPTIAADPGIGRACWNPNCIDPRNKEDDGPYGVRAVYEVKGRQVCRYCYLDGYLLTDD